MRIEKYRLVPEITTVYETIAEFEVFYIGYTPNSFVGLMFPMSLEWMVHGMDGWVLPH